jgi:hypothetical protein
MPVLEATDRLAPRSALRHRPLQKEPPTPDELAGITAAMSGVQRASRVRTAQTPPDRASEEVVEWKRADVQEEGRSEERSAARGRHRQGVTGTVTATRTKSSAARSAGQAEPGAGARLSRPAGGKRQVLGTRAGGGGRLRVHPLLYLGLGMLCMLALWCVVLPAVNWMHTTLDDLRYGRPRTFQVDAFVGHNESAGVPSHFIALNLNGHLEIIELPGGDAAHARIYSGPQLYDPDADLIPVTLDFADVNGDHRPDMIVHFQDTRIVFLNEDGAFRPLRADERRAVLQFLQRHPDL